jgi:hypothetical protein
MNGERLRQTEHIICDIDNQVMVMTKDFRNDDFKLTTRNPLFSSFLVNSNLLSRKSGYKPQALISPRINLDIILHAGSLV